MFELLREREAPRKGFYSTDGKETKVKARNETAPGEGRGLEADSKVKRGDDSKMGGPLAMSHRAQADLHARAAAILAKSIFANRLTSPDVHVIEEALRMVFEREAAFHSRQASKLRHGGHPLEFLEAAFEPRAAA